MERSILSSVCALCLGLGLLTACSGDDSLPSTAAGPTTLPPFGGASAAGAAAVPATFCAAGLTSCNGVCTNVRSDAQNCGQCGASCGPGTCTNALCNCPSTLTGCPGGCVDAANDPMNCGACGRVCGAAERCQQGQCLPLSAICTPACTGGQVCVDNVCTCPAPTALCGDTCVDTATTPQHCGACNDPCAPGQLCQAGACLCPPGQTECTGECADLQTSPEHCGACGSTCAENETCMAGVCRAPAGADGCSGAATGIAIDEVAVYQTIKIPMSDGVRPLTAAERTASIIEDRPTLFRVFVTPGPGFTARELSARVTLTNDMGDDQYFAKQMVMKPSSDGDSASTFQIEVPREKILADTRYSVELVECGALPPTAGMAAETRFPAAGDLPLEARDTGTLKIRIIPLVANSRMPDTSEKALQVYRDYIEAIYPVHEVEFVVDEPMNVSYPVQWNSVIEQLRSKRQADRPPADEYYYGFLRPTDTLAEYCRRGCTAGVGFVGSAQQAATRVSLGLAYADEMSAVTMAHEIGHNHGRGHAPCAPGGQIQGVDRNYPHTRASTGVWGYDSRKKTFFDPSRTTDIMGYCEPKWISDYTYKGLTDRSSAINAQALTVGDPEAIQSYRVLLKDADGPRWSQPFPEPAEPYGTPERADVLDLDGMPIEKVIVYRTEIGDSDGASVLIPEPRDGWHAIKLFDAQALPFSAPITVPAPH